MNIFSFCRRFEVFLVKNRKLTTSFDGLMYATGQHMLREIKLYYIMAA